jgi:outer membrane protein
VGIAFCLPAAAQPEAPIISVFDSSIVFDRSQHGGVLKAELERLRERKIDEIAGKQQELERLQEEFRNKELTFNDDKRAEMIQSINQTQLEFKRMNDDSQRELQAEFNRAQQKLQKELINVVEALGQEGPYTIIIEKGLTLYAAPQVDITERVLQKFDEMYPHAQGAATGP